MAKLVNTQGGKFETLTKAKAHYKAVREGLEIGVPAKEPLRSDLLDIYSRYCDATNYPAECAVDVVARLDNRPRPNGTYRSSKALFVVNELGDEFVFSLDTALESIAT